MKEKICSFVSFVSSLTLILSSGSYFILYSLFHVPGQYSSLVFVLTSLIFVSTLLGRHTKITIDYTLILLCFYIVTLTFSTLINSVNITVETAGIQKLLIFTLSCLFPFFTINLSKLSINDKLMEKLTLIVFLLVIIFLTRDIFNLLSKTFSHNLRRVGETYASGAVNNYPKFLGAFILAWSMTKHRFKLLLSIIGIIYMLLSFSRGSIIALFFGLGGLFIIAFFEGKIKTRQSKSYIKNILCIMLIISGIIILFLNTRYEALFNERYLLLLTFNTKNIEVGQRIEIISDYLKKFIDEPIIGTGFPLQLSEIRYDPHNWFIEVIATSGLFGAFWFFSSLAILTYKAYLRLLKKNITFFKAFSSWVYILYFFGGLFSGSIFSSAALWIAAAFVMKE